MKILIIDNYDSFTFNLVQLIGKNKHELEVVRNDAISLSDVKSLNPDKILISPGPGRPEDSGISLSVISEFGTIIPMLGVCLGMQAICYAFGSEIINSREIFHGRTSLIQHNGEGIFKDIPADFEAMRYHSLIVKSTTLPKAIQVSARTLDKVIMGIRHKKYPLEGIQFHPESIQTRVGKQIISNWISQPVHIQYN